MIARDQIPGPKTAKERAAHGRSRREQMSRASHSELKPKERSFDSIQVLLSAAEGRLSRLLPLKYSRMAVSPFAFFRGAVSVMAADLARLPNTGLHTQLCGDAHVQNLGSFAAPDGKLVFDLNDFDETIPGPWEWDVKRMATSIILAGRAASHKRADCQCSAEAFVESYCRSVAAFARMPILQVARHQIHREERVQPITSALRRSERAKPLDLVKKFTETDGRGQARFRDLKPVFWRVRGKDAKDVLASLSIYRESLDPERRRLFDLFRPIDVGFKVVGTGSVGMRDYVVLFEGNGPTDPLFLQIKQEVQSAYAGYLPGAVYEHEGRRAAEGQRAIQPMSDLLLGWASLGGRQFLVRQLNDHKGSIDIATLQGKGLASLAVVAGEILARGHARAGDACAISGYIGEGTKLGRAVRAFASAYADLTEADYALFMKAVKSGRIGVAEEGAA